ncbi:MAG TPA: efflux RND transporter periplasmic adaptor subunit, partial [Gemmataceae bacterium]|nr:efflux RND transporter periplasmic adaptor subunit [Gemmataceae bacterium]
MTNPRNTSTGSTVTSVVAKPPGVRAGPIRFFAMRLPAHAIHWGARAAGLLVVLSLLAGGTMAVREQLEKKSTSTTSPGLPAGGARPGVELLSPETIRLNSEVVRSLGIRTAEVSPADRPRPLPPLQGVLNVDLNRTVRIHSQFAGIVVALGTMDGGETDRPAGESGPRGLRQWEKVQAGQLLAVVWSKDLGEKKSELVQAVSDLRLARDQLARYQSLTEGIIAQKEVRAAEAGVRSAENSVAKAEATLRAWRLPEEQIRALIAEAEKLGTAAARRELTAAKTWARVEVRAPFAGTLLEKNTNVGDVVDTSADLFRIADLTRLTVAAQVYEEDLPVLLSLPLPIPWEVRVPARTNFRAVGALEQIGEIIDPTQHTALVSGTVNNRGGELKAGQFVTCTVAVPPQSGEYAVPTAALVEDGRTSVVFVQPNRAVPTYVRRPVAVVRRYYDVCYVRAEPAGVRPGDLVVTGGVLQLNQA